jgi:hypothetical protein
MTLRKGLAGVAIVMLALAGAARAQDTGSTDNGNNGNNGGEMTNPGETPATPSNPTPTTPSPLMDGLDHLGISGPLDAANINIYGHVEGGYLYDFTKPENVTPPRTAPGDDIFFAGPYKDSLMLNQLDLAIERAVDVNKGTFDVGFKVEAYYGRDAFFTHSNGILDNDNKGGGVNGSDDQLDLLQAYVDATLPFFSGITLTAGKFVSIMGVETINPTTDTFYTHSYAFSYGLPFTYTGVLSTLNLPDQTDAAEVSSLTFGISRGWNQSTSDNNGVPDGLFQYAHKGSWLSYKFNLNYGPEGFLQYGPSDNHDWWEIPEAQVTLKASDQVSFTVDGLVGNAAHLSTWDDLAGYVTYTIDPTWALSLRAEYYHDGHGVTTGVGGGDVDYGEATYGVAITPLPGDEWFGGLVIRPEIRYDWADRPVFDADHSTQLTAAMDVYFKF